ncbi:hypothetical protein MTO96_010246 [Rhipicephalus appendiculatus]
MAALTRLVRRLSSKSICHIIKRVREVRDRPTTMLSNVDLLSNCERDFIKIAVSEDKRVDHRTSKESRHVRISFGLDRGCCVASLGDTKVMVQVSVVH